jgi:hypothetical protein
MNQEAIQKWLDRSLALLTDCYEAYTAAPTHIRRMMNQAVFERFLVDMDGSSEAEPTDIFGVLLRPDFLMPTADIESQPRERSTHRNLDWTNGRPQHLVKGSLSTPGRRSDRTDIQASRMHRQQVGLNKTHLAEGVGFEPTVPKRAQRFSRPSDSATLASLRRRGYPSRRPAKNWVSKAAESSARIPDSTATSWLSRGSTHRL